MKKQYISRNGQIEYEIDEAGEILTYGRDALGNVVAGYDKNTNAVFTIDYKPFGEFAATTGTITGRRFLWVGTWGYRFTTGVPVSHYIRARHLMMRMGMWTSVDPLWPGEMAYEYVGGMVTSGADYWGLQVGVVGSSTAGGFLSRGALANPSNGAASNPSSTPLNAPSSVSQGGGWAGRPTLWPFSNPLNEPRMGPQTNPANPYLPYDGCPEDEHKNYCDELHDHYKRSCGGVDKQSGTNYGPRPKGYKQGRLYQNQGAFYNPQGAYGQMNSACSCCEGRKIFLKAGCYDFVNPDGLKGLIDAMHKACRMCNDWRKVLFGPYQPPPSPPYPPREPIPLGMPIA